LRSVPKTPGKSIMPTVAGLENDEEEEEAIPKENDEEKDDKMDTEEIEEIKKQLSEGLITLSSVPRAKWTSLADLETIKRRNRPKEPPKKPEQAPFFLRQELTLEGSIFLPPKNSKDNMEIEPISRIIHMSDTGSKTKFVEVLERNHEKKDFAEALEHLKGLSPSGIDFEFQTLSLRDDFKELKLLLEMIDYSLDSNQNFELVQAFLNLFLKHHGETVANDSGLVDIVKKLRVKQRENWIRLQSLFQNSLCLIRHFSGLQT